MASQSIEFKAPPLVAFNTVLVLVPPPEITYRLNPFRRVHDKAGVRWTTHITMMCPFVEEEHLPGTIERLREAVRSLKPFKLRLDKVDKFSMKGYDTVHLTVSRKEDQKEVQQLWKVLADVLEYKGRAFIPHLTLGQAPNRGNTEALDLLLSKADKLLESVKDIEWTVGSVVALKKDELDGGIMKFNGDIFLEGYTESSNRTVSELPTVSYTGTTGWSPCQSNQDLTTQLPTSLSVATYNLLHDSEFPISERIDRLTGQIVATNADILSLQEVSDECLGLLLGSPVIHSTYIFSSRDPAVVLENERNVVVLSKYPFDSTKLDIGGKHKPSCLAVFNQPNSGASGIKRLVVAAIHLTAGRAAAPLEQKTKEFAAIVNHLKTNHPEDDWIIAGDLNWPNEIVATPADDLFIDAGDMMGHQATYDPFGNYLAAKTARESRDGQRYDRIYIKQDGSWEVKRVDIFGVDDNPASDHWGLLSVLEKSNTSTATSDLIEQKSSSSKTMATSSLPSLAKFTTSDLEALMKSEEWNVSQEHESNMQAALALVREVICAAGSPSGSNTSRVIIRIEPVGSYALGIHTTASDIDCVAVGNVSPRTFWMLARSRIRAALTNVRDARNGLRLRRFVKDAIVQMMELEAFGVKIDLQYCAAAKLVECWDDVPNLPTDSPLFNLPVSNLITLNAYRDVLTLKRVLPSLPTFRVAHRALKHLLTSRGFSGARFGFLGGFHLTLLLTRVALVSPSTAKAHHLVEAFLQIYSQWDWQRDIVYPIPTQNSETMPYKRVLQKEPMVILSIERPLANLGSHASRNSVEALSNGLKQAYDMLKEGKGWSELCGFGGVESGAGTSPLNDFLSSHKAFVRLNVHLWGGNCMKGRATVGYLESRFVHFLIQLRLVAPEITVRFWPSRLVDESTVDPNARDPNGIYLFGLTPSNTSTTSTRSREDIEASLSHCSRTFESDLRANERYYDETDTFISLEIVKRSKLPTKIISDPFVWPDNGIDQVEDGEAADSEEELQEMEAATADTAGNALDMWEDAQPLSSAQRKRALAAAKSSKKTTYIPAAKLRTSADVYNRLLWDNTGDVTKDGYLIGYEDRFKGVKEMPLTSWKREVEDESFIPFHRVVYFKRVSDGVYVWDRRTKVDLVFGSGVGAG